MLDIILCNCNLQQKMRFLFLQVILAFIPLVTKGNHAPLDYEFSTSLHDKYSLYWNNPTDGKICMAVEVGTLGWVGLGFSPNGDMVNSDIMMAWVIDGEVTITDRFAVSMSLPVLDSEREQDFELVDGYEEDGKTTIQFCRNLLTCNEDDVELKLGAVNVIYSWNDADPNPIPSQHTTRGVKNLKLIGTVREFPDALDGTTRVDITIGNVTIPNSTPTVYWCRTIRFTQPDTKHHIVKIGAHIIPRNVDYVHHLLVYICPSTFPELVGDCDSASSPIQQSGASSSCSGTLISGWAVGAGDFNLPLEAGIPLGPEEAFDTLLIEIHYNNPNLDAGIVDDSGVSWYITDNLRSHDVGILHLGQRVNDAMSIPPRAELFLVPAYCPGECTKHLNEPINVIATFPHSHTSGVSMWTQLIRDNKEIGYLDLNLNYDFNFQGYIIPEEPIEIRPGDSLVLNCLYNTSARNTFTTGGESTEEEMCLNLIYHYPRIPASTCLTQYDKSTSFTAALDSFQCNGVDVKGSTTREELFSRVSSIEWTDKIARTLEISPLVHPNGITVHCGSLTMQLKFPLPGVDYEVFPYRVDSCGNYNGTYYPGGNIADYYYSCNTNQPYYNIEAPVDPTGSASSILSIPVLMLVLAVMISFY